MPYSMGLRCMGNYLGTGDEGPLLRDGKGNRMCGFSGSNVADIRLTGLL